MNPPKGTKRLAVKLHRRVSLIRTEDAILAAELLSHGALARELLGRLAEDILLVRPDRVEAVIEELQRMGHKPKVI